MKVIDKDTKKSVRKMLKVKDPFTGKPLYSARYVAKHHNLAHATVLRYRKEWGFDN